MVTTSKHTPGPWDACGSNGDIYGGPPNDRRWISQAGNLGAAQLPAPDEAAANVRLLAASLEMLDELKMWVEPWNGFNEVDTARRCDPATLARLQSTRRLIARIEGVSAREKPKAAPFDDEAFLNALGLGR